MRYKRLLVLLLAALLLFGCSKRDLSGEKQPSEPPKQEQIMEETSVSEPVSEPEKKEPKEPLSKKYAKMLQSQKYYIDCTAEIETEGMSFSNSMLIAVDGDNSSITVSSDLTGTLVTIRTLTLDGNIYMVNDTARSYMQIPPEQAANSFNTDFSDMEYIGEGSGDFCGEELYFEEYSKGDESIKLYFKDDNLTGLSRSIEDEEISEMTLKIAAISQNIPEKLITMPIGYQQQ